MRKRYTEEEMRRTAESLQLKRYLQISGLIDEVNATEPTQCIVHVICVDTLSFENLLRLEFGLDLRVHVENIVEVTAKKGEDELILDTEYGEVGVDKDNLCGYMEARHDRINLSIQTEDSRLTNIILRITYIPVYTLWTGDMWRLSLLRDDYVIMVSDAFHVLYDREREFILSCIQPIFSPARMSMAIGNAENVNSTEYQELVRYIHTRLSADYRVFPLFATKINDARKMKYPGHETTVMSLADEIRHNSLSVRANRAEDILNYRNHIFDTEIREVQEVLKEDFRKGADAMQSFMLNKEMVEESRRHVTENIALFLENSTRNYFRQSTDDFSKEFIRSVSEDISASADIRQDARSLPRYMSYVWERFIEEQNRQASETIQKEITGLFRMMQLDLNRMADAIPSDRIRDKVNEKLKFSGNVNSFFARRTSGGNSFTDTLTIGGLMLGIFGLPVGFMAVGASEIIKIAGKKSMDESYKKDLTDKVADTIDKSALQITEQADKCLSGLTEIFRQEITGFYNELIEETETMISDERKRMENAENILNEINMILN